jgi:hypothetical protein
VPASASQRRTRFACKKAVRSRTVCGLYAMYAATACCSGFGMLTVLK